MGFMDKYKKPNTEAAAAAPAPVVATPAPKAVAAPKPKPAPAPAPVITQEAEVETVVVTDLPETPGETFALTLFGGQDDGSGDVLNALISQQQASRTFSPGGAFPFVSQTKGNAGGGLCADPKTPEDIMEVLPQGKGAFTAVFLGHRLVGAGWPQGLNGDTPKDPNAQKDKPVFKVVAASNDATLCALVRKAGEVYQFTKGTLKGKFDGIGHFRPGVELLFFRKGVVFVVAVPQHYSSLEKTLASLAAAFPNGRYGAFPCKVTPLSEPQPGQVAWTAHSLKFAVAVDDKGAEVFNEFKAFAAEVGNDPEFQAAFTSWKASEVDEDGVTRLTQIGSMGR
jgi:hypothetical protein